VDYQGGRDVEPMLDYINTNAGTFRTLSGELTDMAGRIKSLDDVILAVEKFDAAAIAALKEAAAAVTDSKTAAHAKEYLAMAEKVVAKGVEFVEKEIARLTSMIGSNSVNAEKKTGFMIRRNILNAFKKTERV
jgi:protein disulfide-isomerase A6